jgi:hypothetical protein
MNQNNYNLMNQKNYNSMNQNNYNSMNQNIFNSMNVNNFNSMNHYTNQINNVNEVDNSISVIFKTSSRSIINNSIIKIQSNDLISTLIEKYRKKANFYEQEAYFIYNEKILNPSLTITQGGITDNAIIFVIGKRIKITFKFSGLNGDSFPIIIEEQILEQISELIDLYLDYSGLNKSDIIRFVYNSRILNESKSIKEEGLINNSIIYVITKKKINSISILIKYYNKQNEEYKNPFKTKFLVTAKIIALIETFKNLYDLDYNCLNAFLNSEKLDEKKRIEETKISNNSTIIIK